MSRLVDHLPPDHRDLVAGVESADWKTSVLDGLRLHYGTNNVRQFAFWVRQLDSFLEMKHTLSMSEKVEAARYVLEMAFRHEEEATKVRRWMKAFARLFKSFEAVPQEFTVQWKDFFEMIHRNAFGRMRGALPIRPSGFLAAIVSAAQVAARFIPLSATEEIFATVRPMLCPQDEQVYRGICYLCLFLPIHRQSGLSGCPAWLPEVLDLWTWFDTCPGWDFCIARLLSRLAVQQGDRIDWTAHLPFVLHRTLRILDLPVGSSLAVSSKRSLFFPSNTFFFFHEVAEGGSGLASSLPSSLVDEMAVLIVHMIRPGSHGLDALDRLFSSIETYFHPSNGGAWSNRLAQFLEATSGEYAIRAKLERFPSDVADGDPWRQSAEIDLNELYYQRAGEWKLQPADDDRLVSILLPIAKQALFSKNSRMTWAAISTFKHLAYLRPSKVLPVVLEMTSYSLQTLTETHQTTEVLRLLSVVMPVMLRPGTDFPDGVLALPELFEMALPGIDPNDIGKTRAAMSLFSSIFACIHCVRDIDPGPAGFAIAEAVHLWPAQFMSRFLMVLSAFDVGVGKKSAGTAMKPIERTLCRVLQSMDATFAGECARLVHGRIFGDLTADALKPLATVAAQMCRAHPSIALPLLLPSVMERLANLHLCNESEIVWFSTILRHMVGRLGVFLLPYLGRMHVLLRSMIVGFCQENMGAEFDMKKARTVHKYGCKLLRRTLESLTLYYMLDYRTLAPGADPRLSSNWVKKYALRDIEEQWHVPSESELACAVSLIDEFGKTTFDRILGWSASSTSKTECGRLSDVLRKDLLLLRNVLQGASTLIPKDMSKKMFTVPSAAPTPESSPLPKMAPVGSVTSQPGRENSCGPAVVEGGRTDGDVVFVDGVQLSSASVPDDDDTDRKIDFRPKLVLHGALFEEHRSKVAPLTEMFFERVASLTRWLLLQFEDQVPVLCHWIKVVDSWLCYCGSSSSKVRFMLRLHSDIKTFHLATYTPDEAPGVRRYPRYVWIDRVETYYLQRVLLANDQRRFHDGFKVVMSNLLDLGMHAYSEVRSQAQSVLGTLVYMFPIYAIQDLLSQPISILSDKTATEGQWTGATYILQSFMGDILCNWKLISQLVYSLLNSNFIEKASIQVRVQQLVGSISNSIYDLAIREDKNHRIRLVKLRNDILHLLSVSPALHWRNHDLCLVTLRFLSRRDFLPDHVVTARALDACVSDLSHTRIFGQSLLSKILSLHKPVQPRQVARVGPGPAADSQQPYADPQFYSTERRSEALAFGSEAGRSSFVFLEKNNAGWYAWPSQCVCYDYSQPLTWPTAPRVDSILDEVLSRFGNEGWKSIFLRRTRADVQHQMSQALADLFKGLFQLGGRPLLELLRGDMARLADDVGRPPEKDVADRTLNDIKEKASLLCSMIGGLHRGMKHWCVVDRAAALAVLGDVLWRPLYVCDPECVAFFSQALRHCVYDADPVRTSWIVGRLSQDLLGSPRFSAKSPAVEWRKLRYLGPIVGEVGWRSPTLNKLVLDLVLQNVEQPYSRLRDAIVGHAGLAARNLLLRSFSHRKENLWSISPLCDPHQHVPLLKALVEIIANSPVPSLSTLAPAGEAGSADADGEAVTAAELFPADGVQAAGDADDQRILVESLSQVSVVPVGPMPPAAPGPGPGQKAAITRCKFVVSCLQQFAWIGKFWPTEAASCIRTAAHLHAEKDDEILNVAKNALLSQSISAFSAPRLILDSVREDLFSTDTSRVSWKSRSALLTFLQRFAFNHSFLLFADPTARDELIQMLCDLLHDPHVEVREFSSTTLCGFLRVSGQQVAQGLAAKYFLPWSWTRLSSPHQRKARQESLRTQATHIRRRSSSYITQSISLQDALAVDATDERLPGASGADTAGRGDALQGLGVAQVDLLRQERMERILLIKRHAGVLGLCAVVLSHPYGVTEWMVPLLTVLAKHNDDPLPVSTSVKQCFRDFWKTQKDTWHISKQLFDQESLSIFTDLLISPNYYA